MKKLIIIILSLAIFLYLPMAFVFLSFNPVDWGTIGRVIFSMLIIASWGWTIDQYKG